MTNVVEFEHKVIPAGTKTDQELINEGRKIVNLSGRALGEWFNEVRLTKAETNKIRVADPATRIMTAKQICEEADVPYSSATKLGRAVEAFPTEESQRGFSLSTLLTMLPILNKLGADKFDRFLSDAAAGQPYLGEHDPEWTYSSPYNTKDIQHAWFYISRDLKIGQAVAEPEAKAPIDKPVQELEQDFKEGVMSTLPKKTQRKALSEMRKIVKDQEKVLNQSFTEEVERCVEIRLKEERDKMAAARVHLQKAQSQADSELKRLRARLDSTRGIFTKQEYRKIRGCLVSDKQTESERRKFDEAMTIFTRLKRACDQ